MDWKQGRKLTGSEEGVLHHKAVCFFSYPFKVFRTPSLIFFSSTAYMHCLLIVITKFEGTVLFFFGYALWHVRS